MLFLWYFVTTALAIPGLPAGPQSRGMMQCPRSHSPVHAWGMVWTLFKHPCEEVMDEIHARLMHGKTNKGNEWHDPHNGGHYTDLGMGMYDGSYQQIQTMRTSASVLRFKDKQYFTFVPQDAEVDMRRGGGGNTKESCMVYACSVSQGVSATDGGTNFCNVHDLYCNSMDNCEWVKHDLTYHEQKKKVNLGSRDNKWICTGRPKWLQEIAAEEGERKEEIQAII